VLHNAAKNAHFGFRKPFEGRADTPEGTGWSSTKRIHSAAMRGSVALDGSEFGKPSPKALTLTIVAMKQ
jgi:hypothetical protein